MFGFSKKQPPEIPPPSDTADTPTAPDTSTPPPKTGFFTRLKQGLTGKSDTTAEQPATTTPETETPKTSWFSRLKQGLKRTRDFLNTDVRELLRLRKVIDQELLDELETILLTADVGVEATQELIKDLTQRLSRQELKDGNALFDALEENMRRILSPVTQPLVIPTPREKPFVILMVGINGAGKTTTIGKLAKRFQAEGHSVMLAAGDTFRAAAVEQLQTWGERNNVPVVAQQGKADSAAVIFDALQSATAKGIDVLIADTAGRLHTQSNLMDELKKVRRVMSKIDPGAPHEVMLVVDAGNGQNVLMQAKQFHQAVNLTGITVTKLDGTAKGGIVLALAKQMGIPLRFIGVGETVEDLRPFVAEEFVQALLNRDGLDEAG